MICLKEIKIGHQKELFEIDDISLLSSELYVLVGANGIGKTTFLQSIIGSVAVLKGDIKIQDKSISVLKRIDRAKLISFVASKFEGVDYLKVIDYIALGRTPYTNALGRLTSKDWQIVHSSISLLELDYLKDKFTTEISDGERQLVAICRAITQQTDIIILDEPTAFLDYANRKKVMEIMKRIAVDLKKCIIISSHDLELCIESEAKILVINKNDKKLELYNPNFLSKESLIKIGF